MTSEKTAAAAEEQSKRIERTELKRRKGTVEQRRRKRRDSYRYIHSKVTCAAGLQANTLKCSEEEVRRNCGPC